MRTANVAAHAFSNTCDAGIAVFVKRATEVSGEAAGTSEDHCRRSGKQQLGFRVYRVQGLGVEGFGFLGVGFRAFRGFGV